MHILVLPSNAYFTDLFIDSLLHNSRVDAGKLYVVVYGEKYNGSLPVQNVVNWPEVDADVILNAKSLTAMSLTSRNAGIIKKILDINPELIETAAILMTDDELYRWVRCKDKHKKLVASERYLINDDVIALLSIINNFIIPSAPAKEILEYVSGRDDIFVVDSGINFRITKNSQYNVIEEKYRHVNVDDEKLMILLSTKPKSAKHSLMFFFGLLIYILNTPKKKIKNNIFITYWGDKGSKPIVIFRDIVVNTLSVVSKRKLLSWKFVKIKSNKLPIDEYVDILLRNHALVMQDRGGVTSAIEFHYFGGLLFTKYGTFNSRLFSYILSKRKFSYHTHKQLFDMLVKSGEKSCVRLNDRSLDSGYIVRRDNDYSYWKKRFV